MPITINLKKTGTLGGPKPLLAGTHTYKITGAALALNKQDPRGKEQYIAIDLVSGDHPCRINLYVASSNEITARIACETIGSLAKAINFKGDDFKIPDHLKMLIGKSIVVTARETQGKGDNKDKTYVNISDIDAPAGDEGEEETEETEAEEAEEAEETEEETEEEAEEAPPAKAAAGGKKRPWG